MGQTKTKKRRIERRDRDFFTSSSDSDSDNEPPTVSPVVKTRNKWTTPEKEELIKLLPRTIAGIERPGRGDVELAYKKSKIIKKKRSLQTMRIEVSKYFTKKKTLPSPLKKKLFK